MVGNACFIIVHEYYYQSGYYHYNERVFPAQNEFKARYSERSLSGIPMTQYLLANGLTFLRVMPGTALEEECHVRYE